MQHLERPDGDLPRGAAGRGDADGDGGDTERRLRPHADHPSTRPVPRARKSARIRPAAVGPIRSRSPTGRTHAPPRRAGPLARGDADPRPAPRPRGARHPLEPAYAGGGASVHGADRRPDRHGARSRPRVPRGRGRAGPARADPRADSGRRPDRGCGGAPRAHQRRRTPAPRAPAARRPALARCVARDHHVDAAGWATGSRCRATARPGAARRPDRRHRSPQRSGLGRGAVVPEHGGPAPRSQGDGRRHGRRPDGHHRGTTGAGAAAASRRRELHPRLVAGLHAQPGRGRAPGRPVLRRLVRRRPPRGRGGAPSRGGPCRSRQGVPRCRARAPRPGGRLTRPGGRARNS